MRGKFRPTARPEPYWTAALQGIGNVTESAEFNFHADPEAASTVHRLAKCPVTIATWELSYKYNFVPLTWRKEILGKLETSAAALINKLEEVWFRNYLWGDNWILCDQLAMMAALYPDAVTQATNHIARVELGGRLTRGMMVLDKRPQPVIAGQRKNVTIIEKLDRAKLQHCLLDGFSLNSA